MRISLIKVAAAGAVSMCMGIPTAHAASLTQPGETVGLATGAPLPHGFYLTSTADCGCRNATPATCLGITIPIVRGWFRMVIPLWTP
jgi:hypothetical protein